MELKDFIVNFKELFDDVDLSQISPDTKFRDLDDWDSIMGLSVIGMIDDEFGVEFNADDMQACQTIADIYNRIQSKK